MKELVKYLARALVDRPDEVEVTEVEGDRTSIIKLRVAKEDLGLIIGKHGRNAEAIRTILRASAAKLGKKPTLEIIEEDKQS
jgi:predicted RNA-binding protein YlqC (UPF0109 family)